MSKEITTPLSPLQIVKSACLSAGRHFLGLTRDISFPALLCISAFVPLWVRYIKIFGQSAFILTAYEMFMSGALLIVALFMTSLCLFNKSSDSSQNLSFWKFTKEVSLPWTVEGLKATVIVTAGLFLFIVPGIIKQIHYTFFSFIVFFNKSYKKGNTDCLKHSKALSQGLRLYLLGLCVVLPLIINSFPGKSAKIIFENTNSLYVVYPLLALCLYIVCLCFIYLSAVLYFIYVIKDKDNIPQTHIPACYEDPQ